MPETDAKGFRLIVLADGITCTSSSQSHPHSNLRHVCRMKIRYIQRFWGCRVRCIAIETVATSFYAGRPNTGQGKERRDNHYQEIIFMVIFTPWVSFIYEY